MLDAFHYFLVLSLGHLVGNAAIIVELCGEKFPGTDIGIQISLGCFTYKIGRDGDFNAEQFLLNFHLTDILNGRFITFLRGGWCSICNGRHGGRFCFSAAAAGAQ